MMLKRVSTSAKNAADSAGRVALSWLSTDVKRQKCQLEVTYCSCDGLTMSRCRCRCWLVFIHLNGAHLTNTAVSLESTQQRCKNTCSEHNNIDTGLVRWALSSSSVQQYKQMYVSVKIIQWFRGGAGFLDVGGPMLEADWGTELW